jgi:hypothetical protein
VVPASRDGAARGGTVTEAARTGTHYPAMAIPFFWFSQYRQQRWLIMALLVGVVSALEFVLDSRLFDQEALSRQNRYFGGIYAAMAIAVVLLLLTQ